MTDHLETVRIGGRRLLYIGPLRLNPDPTPRGSDRVMIATGWEDEAPPFTAAVSFPQEALEGVVAALLRIREEPDDVGHTDDDATRGPNGE